jgi:hypothetical protein
MLALEVREPALDLGSTVVGGGGGDWSLVVRGDTLLVVSVTGERVVLDAFDLRDGSAESEDLLTIRPELFEIDEELAAEAVVSEELAELGPSDLEECLRTGLSEMGRTVVLYEQGLADVEGRIGLVVSARTPLGCDDLGVSTTLSVEHLVVLDETWNRVQHDRAAWIGSPPLEAVALAEDDRLGAAWLAADGVYTVGPGGAGRQALAFVEPWDPKAPPPHVLAAGGAEVSFVFAIVDRPMASVGQGESYLVVHLATAGDPTYQDVVRVALPDHPSALDACWSGDELLVAMFSEILKPHAESRAYVRTARFTADGGRVGELSLVHEWHDPLGGTFGFGQMGVVSLDDRQTVGWVYRRDRGVHLEAAALTAGGPGPVAGLELAWEEVEAFRLLAGPEGLLVLWANGGTHLLGVSPP